MQIVYYKDPVGNFGDDLNELIWPRVLPDDVRAAPDTVLVGIGSLLDQARFRTVATAGKQVFVLGSGAAYGQLPDDHARWTYAAVRGPLTAEVVGHPAAAATDSAALLARLPDLVPRSARPDEILFMPHHRTLVNSRWQAAAERAGMNFVDPQWRPDRILAAYGRARLVVTEAMHGAIVADTLRIPWVPVMISTEVSIFKWRDWAASVGVAYRPVALPPTARLEAFRYDRIRRLTEASGRSVAHTDAATVDDAALIADFRNRFREEPAVIDSVAAPGAVKAVLKAALTRFDGRRLAAASRALRAVAEGQSYLSDDTTFGDRLGQLEQAVDRVIAQVRAG
ncbi:MULTISPECIES: polysaccharide pyruvyl transferase family protein [unclassified Sphingomonas]|uniref:polysaccharide pyruvyl transferase family protein n=1 Tax=unclassified Sphingomonas TaxID=196159 RepID=UPI001F573163|nr:MULTISPECIES: polysaccharide pyruvyl transferase family protein [unclassified Sphingomonas]